MIVEYCLQNDLNETDPKKNPYPNIFILTKKYATINEVKVRDVVDGFPLNGGNDHKYLLRFETQA